MPGAPWRRISYFAEYLSSKGWNVLVLGALSPTRESLRPQLRRSSAKHATPFALRNLQLRLDLLGWPSPLVNVLGSLPIIIVALIFRPDVLLVSIPWYDVLPIAYIGAKLSGAKLVVDVRDPLEYWSQWTKGFTHRFSKLLTALNYALLRKSDLVLAVTPGLVKLLAKQGVRARLVMNGADTRVFRPYPSSGARKELGLSDEEIVLVFNGYLGNYYDAIPLLRAIAEFPSEVRGKIKLLLIGGFVDPAYARKFLDVIKKLYLYKHVKIHRPVKNARTLAKILSAANAGVITHVASELYDPAVPVKLYEYLACGLPVFALTRHGSELWKWVTKWEIGFACEPNDRECIIYTLGKILDENMMKNLRTNVLHVKPLIDRRHAAKKLYVMLCELLGSSENPQFMAEVNTISGP